MWKRRKRARKEQARGTLAGVIQGEADERTVLGGGPGEESSSAGLSHHPVSSVEQMASQAEKAPEYPKDMLAPVHAGEDSSPSGIKRKRTAA